MPIRFQVDPDFYDHPKTINMSSDAFALWVRAGSFSAAKSTDGFVHEDVVAVTLGYELAVADELVRRRLWRRVRGGYRFHQYEDRNLTKSRIEADRAYDRDRKRRERRTSGAGKRSDKHAQQAPVDNVDDRDTDSREQQVDSQIVRTGHLPDIRPDSERNPNRSVSVSVSGSVSGSGRDSPPAEPAPPSTHEPPPQCPDHLGDDYPPPCGKCADARRRHEAWERAATSRRQHGAALPPSRTAARCRRHIGQPAHNCALCRADALAGD